MSEQPGAWSTPSTSEPGPAPSGRPADPDWWRDAVTYQVYPRSFADADGDGVGDLPGVLSRIPYLRDLGVDAVWLSPFFVSPQHDAGYDVADYRDVDPVFGTLADLDRLVAAAHEHGLRVVIDLVPNHTSDEHPWFRAAMASPPGSPERARYLFRDGTGERGEQPPSDWRSVFGGPAWARPREVEADGSPGQWYLHLFDVHQPDLDWTCPDVAAEFESILRFWLDRGVDGFRVDVAHGLIKDLEFPSWSGPSAGSAMVGPEGLRAPMWDQEAVHDVYRHWRKVLEEYPHAPMLVAEAWVHPPHRQARYVRPDEMHQAFSFDLVQSRWDAATWAATIDSVLAENAAVGAPATWVLSNHDVVRHATRLAYPPETALPNGIGADDPQPDAVVGLRRARAATLLLLALPGAAYVYQGEELGLPEHTTLPDEVRQDPTWVRSGHTVRGRDGCRVPLPWRAGVASLGFGPGEQSWLPQPQSWSDLAVDRQDGDPHSTLSLYRAALRSRRAMRLGRGGVHWRERPDGVTGVIALVNEAPGGRLLVVCNVGTEPVRLPAGATPLVSSDSDGTPGTVARDETVWALI